MEFPEGGVRSAVSGRAPGCARRLARLRDWHPPAEQGGRADEAEAGDLSLVVIEDVTYRAGLWILGLAPTLWRWPVWG